MASQDTLFVPKVTNITADWTQPVNDLVWKGRNQLYTTSTNVSNAYTITLTATSLYSSLVAGDSFTWKVNATNTGAATLTVIGASSIGPTALVNDSSGALIAGDLLIGSIVTTVYDGTSFQIKSVVTPNFLQSGTGAVSRTMQSKLSEIRSIADFGTVGTADDTAVIQAAINASYGSALYFPSGTYYTTGLTVSGEIQLHGDGYSRTGLVLKAGTANANVITVNNAPHFVMMDMTVNGNKANCPTAWNGVYMTGTNSGAEFYRVFFATCATNGLSQAGTADNMIVKDCIAEVNGNDGFQIATASGILDGNRSVLNGRFGIVVTGGLNQITNNRCTSNVGTGISAVNCNYLLISDNLCINNGVAATSYAHGIGLNNCEFYSIVNNYCAGNIGNGIDSTLASQIGVIDGNVCFANADNGIAIDSQSNQCVVTSNNIQKNSNAGISVYSCVSAIIQGNQIIENGLNSTACAFAGSGAFPHGINLDGYTNGGTDYYSFYALITGNQILFNSNGSGIHLITGAITPNLSSTIANNNILYNSTSITQIGGAAIGSNSIVKDNHGFKTLNSGTSAIASGTTTVTVTHGLDLTPNLWDIAVMQDSPTTNDPGYIYVSNATSTTFNVNCRSDPGATTLAFVWKASIN